MLTSDVLELLIEARRRSAPSVECSFDLKRSISVAGIGSDYWTWGGDSFPYPDKCKERTIYHWTGEGFEPVARYSSSLFKLVPTDWGPPTFEIDGIKMLPTAQVSPYIDAQRKVALIQPRGKRVLDTCGGLGYFAAWCLDGQATQILSFEKSLDVIWLRTLNPWSPPLGVTLTLTHGDVAEAVLALRDNSFDAVLHDPPRFGIAGELYSQTFYGHLARVLRRKGRLFHYTGTPNQISSGRDVPREVTNRLRKVGFSVEKNGDGLLAVKE